MTSPRTSRSLLRDPWLMAALATGIVCRLVLPLAGENWDMAEWRREADAFLSGENIYSVTAANRGFIWSMLLAGVRGITNQLSAHDFVFNWSVSLLCTAADLWLACLLYRWYGTKAFLFWILNPVAIFIAGYHRHCDVLSIAIGFHGMRMIERGATGRKALQASLLLGTSLITKHVLLFYPIWLLLRPGPWRERLMFFLIPPLMLLLAFLPFWVNDPAGVMQHVVEYRPFGDAPLWYALNPANGRLHTPPMRLWVLAIVAVGYLIRRVPVDRQFAWYLIALVVTAPATGNQYLVIPVVGIAMLGPVLTYLPYVVLSSLWLYVFSVDGPGFFWNSDYFSHPDRRRLFYDPILILLVVGVAGQMLRTILARTARPHHDTAGS